MTELLRQAIAQIEQLPPEQQDAIATRLLAELQNQPQPEASESTLTPHQPDQRAATARPDSEALLSMIIRTERGLTIAGTRITLYDVMDYVTAQYPAHFIRGLFNLTETQINAALAYIETHRAAVEVEYQQVLKEAEELRQYYEEKNRDLIARLATKPPKPGMEAAWEKLQAQKAKHKAERESRA
ncbi:MAG: DUF433 domain-containing protein [Oculatellaceae cyanobacterium Prado106]|nr:DUF433 domain-containing protein [Oculatellaceae cyanobacterium Prado106]